MKKLCVAVAAAALVVLAGCGSDDDASTGGADGTGKPVDINVAVTGPVPLNAPLFLGILDGSFKKAGLNVSYTILPETNIAAALVSGNSQLTLNLPPSLNLAAQGKPIQLVYGNIGGGAGLYTAGDVDHASITDCEEVVGMVKGGSVYAAAETLKDAYGADFDYLDRYNIASLMTAAALKGEGDCIIGSYPNVSPVIASGKMKLLVDPGDRASLPASFPTKMAEAAVIGMKSTLESSEMKAAMPKFLKVWQDELAGVQSKSSADVVAELRKNPDFTAQPEDQQVKDFESLRPFMSPGDGYITPESWKQTLTYFINGDVVQASADDPDWSFDKMVNMSFYDSGIGKP